MHTMECAIFFLPKGSYFRRDKKAGGEAIDNPIDTPSPPRSYTSCTSIFFAS